MLLPFLYLKVRVASKNKGKILPVKRETKTDSFGGEGVVKGGENIRKKEGDDRGGKVRGAKQLPTLRASRGHIFTPRNIGRRTAP